MEFIVKINPITHTVRTTVVSYLDISPIAEKTLNPPLAWGSFVVQMWLQLTLVAVVGVLLLGAAIMQFSRTE